MPHIYVLPYAFRNICLWRAGSTSLCQRGGTCGARHWRIETISALLDLTKFGSEASSAARRPADDETAPQFAPDSPPSREGVATEQFPNQIAVPYRDFQRRDPTKPLDVVVLLHHILLHHILCARGWMLPRRC
jgi:hypothetical protein